MRFMEVKTPNLEKPAMPGGGVFGRSALAEVRNPILGLPAARSIMMLPPAVRGPLAYLLRVLAQQADEKAEEAWRKRKGILAAYWRAVCTYAKHIARAIEPKAHEPSAALSPWMPMAPVRDLNVAPWDGRRWLIGLKGYPPVVAEFTYGINGYWWHYEGDSQCEGHYQEATHYAAVFPIPGGRA